MKKETKKKGYILLLLLILCILVSVSIRILFKNRTVQAFVEPLEVYVNDPVSYGDSSYFSNRWLWEFGDNPSVPSRSRSGQYRYSAPGQYRIKLTVNDDKKYEKYFMVHVKERFVQEADSLIRIVAPEIAMQGEHIVFRGIGYARTWKWSFGETGVVDSREKMETYAYSQPGIYQVMLETEDTKYPIFHTIEILPTQVEEEADLFGQVGNDIKEHLQAIVDGKPFNTHYNYILNKYLCRNPNILVTVNDSRNNDFYSYCQGLRIIGKNKTFIQHVVVIPDDKKENCLKKIHVSQVSTSNN